MVLLLYFNSQIPSAPQFSYAPLSDIYGVMPKTGSLYFKRGKKYVSKHVGTDSQMTLMSFRRAFAQSLRHMVEVNHRSEVHMLTVVYDPRAENPSLSFFGSRELLRAALKSTLKDEICAENPPKQFHKPTLRMPVFAPRDLTELDPLIQKEQEDHSLTNYWYQEMQRCTFPMHFFKQKANDSWIPRSNLAFWPRNLQVNTVHEPEFGSLTDGRKLSHIDTIIHLLAFLKEYYHNFALKGLGLKLERSPKGPGIGFVFSEDESCLLPANKTKAIQCENIIDRELCTRTFVNWILRPQSLPNANSDRNAAGDEVDVEPDYDYEDANENDDIDVCGVEEAQAGTKVEEGSSTLTGSLHRFASNHHRSEKYKGEPGLQTTSTGGVYGIENEKVDSPVTRIGDVRTMVINGKTITFRRVARSELDRLPPPSSIAPSADLERSQTTRYVRPGPHTRLSHKRAVTGMDDLRLKRERYDDSSPIRDAPSFHGGEVILEETVVTSGRAGRIQRDEVEEEWMEP